MGVRYRILAVLEALLRILVGLAGDHVGSLQRDNLGNRCKKNAIDLGIAVGLRFIEL